MNRKAKILCIVFSMVLAVSLMATSCAFERSDDGELLLRLNPKTADDIEKGGEAGVEILKILAPFLPPGGGIIAGAAATALGLFKRHKKKLTTVQTKADMSHTVAGVTVDAFELLKKEHPDVWKKCIKGKIGKALKSAQIDTEILENFIRGLRKLPPKK